jgi:Uma2 family endonuclease
MSSPVKILPHYTYLDYIKWEGQWELIEGIPYAMSPLPRLRHQEVAGNIYIELKTALKKSKCNCKAFLPLDYKISEDTVLQPDVLVICNPEMDKKNLEKTPQLVVEVLSPATMLKDRNTKFYIYEEQRVPYYIIIDVDKNEIEIYRLTKEGRYELEKVSTTVPYTFILDTDCSVDVLLNNIWE